MNVEHYIPAEHEPTVMSWYDHYEVADRILPGTMSPFGAVVSDDEGPIMAGFLYLAIGCTACFAERLIARPGNTPRQARDAGTILFGFLCELAKQHEYEHIYCHVERPQMAHELEALGFDRIGSGASLLTASLC